MKGRILIICFCLMAGALSAQTVSNLWSSGAQTGTPYNTTFDASNRGVSAITISNQSGGDMEVFITYTIQTQVDTLIIPDCHTYSGTLNSDRYKQLTVNSTGGGVFYIIGSVDNRGVVPMSNMSQLIPCAASGSGAATDTKLDEVIDSISVSDNIAHEIYRVDGAETGTSTAATAPGSTPTVGNTVTISSPYKSIAWRFMRQSPNDTGNGALGTVVVNGFTYYPGSGTTYIEDGFSISAAGKQNFSNNMKFDATGTAVIEIIVIR